MTDAKTPQSEKPELEMLEMSEAAKKARGLLGDEGWYHLRKAISSYDQFASDEIRRAMPALIVPETWSALGRIDFQRWIDSQSRTWSGSLCQLSGSASMARTRLAR